MVGERECGVESEIHKFIRTITAFPFLPAHTVDVRQNGIPSTAKWEHVRID